MESWFAFHALFQDFQRSYSIVIQPPYCMDCAPLPSLLQDSYAAPQVSHSGQFLLPSFCLKLQSAVGSQTESSWLMARTDHRKGGFGAVQLALRSGVIPETACKVILPIGLLWGHLQTCHSPRVPFCEL